MRHAILLTSVRLAVVAMPAWALVASMPSTGYAMQASTRDLAKARVELQKVRDRLPGIQRDLDRAARENSPAVRTSALADWQRALDGVKPFVENLSVDVPEERPLREEYDRMIATYNEAAGTAGGGKFFLDMTRSWSALTAGTEGWEDEKTPTTFKTIATTRPDDQAAMTLGMPKTVAFVKASNKYLSDVRSNADYERFKAFPNIKNDLAQVEAARGRAQEKLAKAADQILAEARGEKLDQNGRDRLDRFVEADLGTALAGYPGQQKLQSRGRAMLYDYDKTTLGEEAAADKSKERLTKAADAAWPQILERYKAEPMPAAGAGRGHIIMIHDAVNLANKDFPTSEYDFAGFIDGAPVVGNFDPVIRDEMKEVLKQTNLKTLPGDTRYEIVGVVRGAAQVQVARTRVGPATTPTTDGNTNAPATQPTTTTCTLIDIVALKAGPVVAAANAKPEAGR